MDGDVSQLWASANKAEAVPSRAAETWERWPRRRSQAICDSARSFASHFVRNDRSSGRYTDCPRNATTNYRAIDRPASRPNA
jgi:hypothetical protein